VLGAILLVPIAGAWYAMSQKVVVRKLFSTKVLLKENIPAGANIEGDLITWRNEGELKIYSSSCTHLGCRINKIDGEELVCPCHGSRFEISTGLVSNGPASSPLEEVEYELEGDKLILKLER
jgi:Rieske Fe-S protein